MVVDDLKSKAITPIYLLTDHRGFYEKYGWERMLRDKGYKKVVLEFNSSTQFVYSLSRA